MRIHKTLPKRGPFAGASLLRVACLGVVLSVWPIADLVQAQEWTRFRGPNGSGVSTASTVPVEWTADDYNWRVELPGVGHSSPVLWGDRVFLTCADLAAGQGFLVCLDTATGEEQWRQTFPLQKYKKHAQNSFATPTPVVDAERVYMLWQSPQTSQICAFTHQGDEVWRSDLGEFKAGHGSAVSLVEYDGMIYFCNDQTGPSYLLALDAATGAERWKLPRETDRACYSTPCIYAPTGRPVELIVSHSYEGITSHNPQTGEQLWRMTPFGDFQQRACASPIIAGELVIACSGFATAEKNVVVVKPPHAGGPEKPEEAYRLTKTAPHVPTPLVHGDRIYLWNDRGIATCADLATGKTIWVQRVGGNYFGSPVWIDGKLYCIDTDGVVSVISASDEYELLARNPLDEGSCATPAVAGGVLYLRTDKHLVSLGGEKSK
ncbi:outer membrane protein assembly factor BamB family protein [Lignipirellula cremea]|uniref:Outer membrane biogenesis protein BamB n=1 Tax=Lignipirellula cremea TaxID=2528010 RepID=A0A518E078_9BACT|nr:PQQ-binding-like beta-propeller repeat protein [Lignipirellula cremea]QDU97479.1 outer membrane biogenesis protein BamB [Lignipirellula cremea]